MKDVKSYKLTEKGVQNLNDESANLEVKISNYKALKYGANEEALKHINSEIRRLQFRKREIKEVVENCILIPVAIVKKFKVTQEAEYVMGYLRMGHKEVTVEADNVEEAEEKAKELLEDAKIIVSDYSVEDYEMMDELEIEEVK